MNRTRLMIALAALLLATPPATAFVRESSNWDPRTLPIHFAVNQGSIPSAIGVTAAVQAVNGGFASWSAQQCTSWQATNDGNTSSVADTNDRRNTIIWVSGSWPPELGDPSVTIGITTPVWQQPGYFIDADIQFNNVGFTWVALTCPGGQTRGNQVDAQSIATHEEGHFLGLGHTPVQSGIMYASYSGNCKRNLDPDDAMGVCTIYPRGAGCSASVPCTGGAVCMGGTCITPPPDAGNPTTGCGSATDCLSCAQMATCGWCGGLNHCYDGNQSGPSGGSCPVGWVWDPNACGASTNDAGPPQMGMGGLGDPCMGGNDCSSGVCISSGTSTFCSQVCNDDCNCPSGYHCYPTTGGGPHVCAQGPHTCATQPDSGTVVPDSGNPVSDSGNPGTDSGTPGRDATVGVDATGTDVANGTDGASGGDSGTPTHNPGCACRAGAGSNASRTGASGWLLALGVAGVISRRRRRRLGR